MATTTLASRRRSSASPRLARLERLARLRGLVTEGVASRPGVYRMLGEDGAVLYVGKSKSLRERLLGYFRQKGRDKGARILRDATHIDWSYEPSEFAALRRELELIKAHRPPFNVVSKRDKSHYSFLRLTAGPAPRLVVHRASRGKISGDGLFYGPFLGPDLVEAAARELTDALGLRDCADDTPIRYEGGETLVRLGRAAPREATRPPKGCIRLDIHKCLGPCVARCTASEYEERALLARAFLEGDSEGPIPAFRAAMAEHARHQAYERAALYRDKLQRIEGLAKQFKQMRFSLESLSFVYPVEGALGDDRVYLVRRGTVRAERPAPKSTAERFELARAIDAVFAPGEPATAPIRIHEIEEVLLLSSWFRLHPDELARTWLPS